MSVIPINRQIVKLIAALAIPASIIFFFVYSQQQANIEVAEYKKQQKDNPNAENIVVQNYSIKEVDDFNHVHWQLTAKSGSLASNNQDVALEDVKVDYFDGPTLKMRLIAPKGEANQVTHYVKLSSNNGIKVIAEGEGGKSRLEANAVELTKKNQFLANGDVIIEWPQVAKVTGDSATGSIDLSGGPKDFKIAGNTHAQIFMQEADMQNPIQVPGK